MRGRRECLGVDLVELALLMRRQQFRSGKMSSHGNALQAGCVLSVKLKRSGRPG